MNSGEKIITLFSTGFYTGYFPFAPATFGTFTVGIPLYLLCSRLSPLAYGASTFVLLLVAVWLSDHSEKIFQKKDCRFIVIDELVGFLITMFLVPCEVQYLIGGFIFFRLSDIIKPPPAHLFNRRKKNGLDVVLDDVVAGVYANLVLQGIHYFSLSTEH